MTKIQMSKTDSFEILKIVILILFVICDLLFGISLH